MATAHVTVVSMKSRMVLSSISTFELELLPSIYFHFIREFILTIEKVWASSNLDVVVTIIILVGTSKIEKLNDNDW